MFKIIIKSGVQLSLKNLDNQFVNFFKSELDGECSLNLKASQTT